MNKQTIRWALSLAGMTILAGCAGTNPEQTAMIHSLQEQVVNLEAQNQQLNAQLAQVTQARIPSGVTAVSTERMGTRNYSGEVVDQTASGYSEALALYQAGDIDNAITAFQNFLNSGAQGDEAAYAQYWIGDGYYTRQNYSQAVRYLGTFLKNMPQSEKTDPALKKLIASLRAVGRDADAAILEQQGVNAIER